MTRLSLEYGSAPGSVVLRELRGCDEEAVEGTDSAAALALLDRLIVVEDAPGAARGPGRAAELAVADRDRLLAAVYLEGFGARVASTVRCRACGEPFDLDFSLEDLRSSVHDGRPGVALPEGGGVFRLADGRRFRLPTGLDERAAAALPPEERETGLLRLCVVEAAPGQGLDGLAEAMQDAGPLLDVEVDARCPECGQRQGVRFDLQHYLLARILGERRLRAVEVHRLARAYGWPLGEILGLPRSRRRMHVELVERDVAAAR